MVKAERVADGQYLSPRAHLVENPGSNTSGATTQVDNKAGWALDVWLSIPPVLQLSQSASSEEQGNLQCGKSPERRP